MVSGMLRTCVSVVMPLWTLVALADVEPTVIPGEVTLEHRGAMHGLIVENREGDRYLGEVTAHAVFESSAPDVAVVEDGVVRAVADGTATITATVDGKTSQVRVTVRGAETPPAALFRNHVQPILFKTGCNTGACHGAQAGKNGFKLSLRGYDHDWDHKTLTRAANGRRLSLAEPDESLILLKATMQTPHEGGLRFEKDSEAYRTLREWIQAGAHAASPDDPTVERLEVLPHDVILATAADQQLLVRAHYSDGTYADVTRWAKFGTSDESVAIVDDLGKVTVKGAGATAIGVWYSSRVTSARVTVPRANPGPAAVLAAAERRNFVDDFVLKQLESLQIAPSSQSTDAEFVRRAYLDAIGVLPTPAETFAFVFDPRPDKRAILVDQLLSRPEYVDYWAYKWSDLLLLSSRNLPKREELNAFYKFIRQSVEKNQPWDTFASEIMTAKGSTVENGAANYFVMHKETVDVTETTSQAFLGMSITCARCHNHPLEKWTQDDYYGMANLFARVKLKNGPRDDTTVLPASFGDILHPRVNAAVAPKPLDGAPLDIHATGDRREYLAKWLTSPENPYFTRAIVNRVWRNFMGRGLVEPEDDLRLTNPATNEALMDALAADLVEHRYDLKHQIRTIMTSAAYGRSTRPSDPAAPDEKYYSHYIIRRLSAEVLLDAYSQVTGVPTEFAGYPVGYRALQLPDSQVASYFLSSFGRPPRIQTCSCERTEDSNVAQTLHVANGETLNGKLRHDRSIAAELTARNAPDHAVVTDIYLRALARYPNDDELRDALEVLASVPREGGEAGERRQVIEDLVWAVLSGKEFMFNH